MRSVHWCGLGDGKQIANVQSLRGQGNRLIASDCCIVVLSHETMLPKMVACLTYIAMVHGLSQVLKLSEEIFHVRFLSGESDIT